MIEFRQISKRYPDGTDALKHINLFIGRGEFCVVLGPSGAGKSTLLRMLNGLAIPSSGQIVFDGELLNRRNLRQIQQRVAMIHQSFNLVPRMSVLNNVLSGLLTRVSTVRALLGLYSRQSRRRACELIYRVGLTEEQLYRRAGELSGGQQQRVGIARAFISNPTVVLADEPVASLDPEISRSILSLLKEASREQGATVLCSLHQVDLTREFADRIIGLREGQVIFDGTPATLTEDILNSIYAQAGTPITTAGRYNSHRNSLVTLRTVESS